MSCQLNVDPYNNYPATEKGGPPPRPGQVHGTFGTRVANAPESNTTMAQRPPPRSRPAAPPQPKTLEEEIAMLYSDLQTAIGYIQHLGGTWPPPGH